jgi:hypothetical protein
LVEAVTQVTDGKLEDVAVEVASAFLVEHVQGLDQLFLRTNCDFA